MDFEAALIGLRAGKWVRRDAWRPLMFVVMRSMVPPEWVLEFDDELVEVTFDPWECENIYELSYRTIGPTEFGETEKVATDWDVVDIERPLKSRR